MVIDLSLSGGVVLLCVLSRNLIFLFWCPDFSNERNNRFQDIKKEKGEKENCF